MTMLNALRTDAGYGVSVASGLRNPNGNTAVDCVRWIPGKAAAVGRQVHATPSTRAEPEAGPDFTAYAA